MNWTRKSKPGTPAWFKGRHKFEHWYRDNQVYFLTARVRRRLPAFTSEQAKIIFWRQFDRYTREFGFTPWVTSLLDNHYHTIGYLKVGVNLAPMMQRLHGSVAKLVNDVLEQESVRLKPHCLGRIAPPFWGDKRGKNYMDGCLRDPLQGVRTYRYVYRQAVRHGLVRDPRDYPHTRVNIEMMPAIRRAEQLDAFLRGVRYRRYEGDPHP